jgi:Raf kinase inhibitor-like YbhB/YbcL family protein
MSLLETIKTELPAQERRAPMRKLSIITSAAFGFLVLANFASAQGFAVSSKTFTNNMTQLPNSMILTRIENGANVCTADGTPGENLSPQLSWTNPPTGTTSFVVVVTDLTASAIHWGMYNIPVSTTHLPQDAGRLGSTEGLMVNNDVDGTPAYAGPCPPKNLAPVVHQYRFAVYALSTTLNLPFQANFPANSITLYRALFRAARDQQILGSATIEGNYSSAPK